LADYIATGPEPSLSLPIRMDKKRQRMRTGTIFTVMGLGLLGGAGYNFTHTGRELIAVYMTVLALIVLAVGISQFGKASRGG
jgi:hypothetical protein